MDSLPHLRATVNAIQQLGQFLPDSLCVLERGAAKPLAVSYTKRAFRSHQWFAFIYSLTDARWVTPLQSPH
jgi:hypothetical protein